MERQFYINSASILPLHRKVYDTIKVNVSEEFLSKQKDLKYLQCLLRLQKRILRFVSEDCPEDTKVYLKKEILHSLEEYGFKVRAYYLLDELRKVEIVKDEEKIINIFQKNVYFPPELEPKEMFVND
jgi:hypothetical protein